MNNIIVYLEIEEGVVADVSLELLTKARSLATKLKCKLEALAIGSQLDGIGAQVFQYGVDKLYLADDAPLSLYFDAPHFGVGQSFQGRKTTNRPDGCYQHRS